ncbi:MAG: pantetheine-phosphate adenylyltransferase [Thermodesulfobacteriota bacterium]|jgi:pantetheine-phosphate adenylyltransferase|nr:pantetheine-phosphate adenylyltransferase [Thermodesulfobacteriota bacterium]
MEKIAMYPGSFDPITNGHLNIIERSLLIFDKLVIAVAINAAKQPLFTVEERVAMIKEVTNNNPNVMVDSFDGLLVDYVAEKNIHVLVRGLRAMSDFEYEFQMTFMNRKLNRSVETIFMMTGLRWFYVNSRIIKEVAFAGGSVKGLVPDVVSERLKEKFPLYRQRNGS